MGTYAHMNLTIISQPVGSEKVGNWELGKLRGGLRVFMCPRSSEIRDLCKYESVINRWHPSPRSYIQEDESFLSPPLIRVRSARNCHLALVLVDVIVNLVPAVEKEAQDRLFHIRGRKMKQDRVENMRSEGGEEHLRKSEKEAPAREVGSLHPPRAVGGSVMLSMQTHARP